MFTYWFWTKQNTFGSKTIWKYCKYNLILCSLSKIVNYFLCLNIFHSYWYVCICYACDYEILTLIWLKLRLNLAFNFLIIKIITLDIIACQVINLKHIINKLTLITTCAKLVESSVKTKNITAEVLILILLYIIYVYYMI